MGGARSPCLGKDLGSFCTSLCPPAPALRYWCHFLPLLVQSRGLKSGGSLFKSLSQRQSFVALSKSSEFFELLCTRR